ncbi:RimK domain-containing protein ATP-grasp [Actinoplanes sp. TBRC 11911]|uniref:RimK domain-containing protein ATP-grasp n=1 Tax=Actinoplanes sp. TBRC 11911 TaxID=2729386 RepID=UPI00145F107A|nr:RimK domain-containing protein ATP-grasp [Actinoplanes sp. TBRC 11911]NMO55188.1 RimK domain-containing protein ATP-grasp [Actinoplanes sp. TBRC 11911]
MTVLLWGLPGDSTMTAVRNALRVPSFFLDQHRVLETRVEPGGRLEVGGKSLRLDEVSAAYLRPHDSARLPAVRDDAAGRRHAQQVDEALACWSELTPALVISRPSAAASNGSKPAQIRHAAACGFPVPETLVTNDPVAAASFARQHGEVVYKSVSAIRSRVRRLTARDDLAQVAVCPTQFQAWIPGTDVRVHVVGAETFATRVESEADDYRYAASQGLPRAELSPFDLPDVVAARCQMLTARLGLPVAGVDLRVTADDEWYCFEVNPSPAFAYYEAGAGQPIAAAVAGLLAAAYTCAVTR